MVHVIGSVMEGVGMHLKFLASTIEWRISGRVLF